MNIFECLILMIVIIGTIGGLFCSIIGIIGMCVRAEKFDENVYYICFIIGSYMLAFFCTMLLILLKQNSII